MSSLQKYLFRQILGPFAAILLGLAVVAILTQSLTQIDIIVDQRRSAFAFAWVTLLAVPQLVGLVMPLALFFAVVFAINRMHGDSEIAVAQSAGMSNAQIASPILKLSALAALFHLALTTLVAPAAYREIRETVYSMRTDIAASLVREGSFTTPAKNLTLYARETLPGGAMRDMLINDARNANAPLTFTARTGVIATIDGAPALIMRDGQVQQPKADGSFDLLDFDQYVLQLGDFFAVQEDLFLKSSDRYLGELFYPDMTAAFDIANRDAFLAEGHSRLASPLLSIAMGLIAAAVMLRGDVQRLGYGARIARAGAIALAVRLVALGIQAASGDDPDLNVVQYIFPLAVAGVAAWMFVRARFKKPGPVPAELAAGAA
ncbi:MAG: LptF/LptG family permease [Alphaproteobacteria bacterium]|nr:LptF/LptG family permease [Alphaproteobacteria bacterium]